jgi:hypothetical protein
MEEIFQHAQEGHVVAAGEALSHCRTKNATRLRLVSFQAAARQAQGRRGGLKIREA